jgi:hypothetical protein
MLVGLYGWWPDDYLYSPEALSMWNMYILHFHPITSEYDINLFKSRMHTLASNNIMVILDLFGIWPEGQHSGKIDYSVIDTIFNVLELVKDDIFAVTLFEENDLQAAAELNAAYNYIKEKWPWATVYQWFGFYPVYYSSISSVGADGYVIDPNCIPKQTFINCVLPYFKSGKPIICQVNAAIEPDWPCLDTLSDQIPILHGLQIPTVFYAMFEWRDPDAPAIQRWIIIPKAIINPDSPSTLAAKWQEIQDAITTLDAPLTMTVEEFAATLHVTPSRSIVARTIGPLGVPKALLHQLWRLRERFIRPEVHRKLHPLV